MYRIIPEDVFEYAILPHSDLEQLYRLYLNRFPGSLGALLRRASNSTLEQLYRLYQQLPESFWLLEQRLRLLSPYQVEDFILEVDDPNLFLLYQMPDKEEALALLRTALEEGKVEVAKYLASILGPNALAFAYHQSVIPLVDLLTPEIIQRVREDKKAYTSLLIAAYYDCGECVKEVIRKVGWISPDVFWGLVEDVDEYGAYHLRQAIEDGLPLHMEDLYNLYRWLGQDYTNDDQD